MNQIKNQEYYENLSMLLYFTINKIRKIGSALASSFAYVNLYSCEVSFPFFFSETKRYDPIYLDLINIVSSFEGNLQWIMAIDLYFDHEFDDDTYYIIQPIDFYIIKQKYKLYGHSSVEDYIAPEQLKRLNDLAFEDIPNLCKRIEDKFDIK